MRALQKYEAKLAVVGDLISQMRLKLSPCGRWETLQGSQLKLNALAQLALEIHSSLRAGGDVAEPKGR